MASLLVGFFVGEERWQLCKLIQALGQHAEGIDDTEAQKGLLLDGGVLVLARCHLIRFGLFSDYE